MVRAEFPDPVPHGFLIGRYRVDAELAPQSFGRTYRATDTSLDETVALIVLAVDLRDTIGRRRFLSGVRRAVERREPVYNVDEWLEVPYAVVKYQEDLGAIVDVAMP